MGSHRATTRALVVVGVFVTAAAGSAGQTRLDGEVFQRFRLAVDAYVAVHREVEQHVPPLEMSSDARKIHHAVEAMAAAMRAARPFARAGDIFDAATGALFRDRIRDVLREGGHDPADILTAMRDDDLVLPEPVRPVVNGAIPWTQGAFMPGCLLEALPGLPPEIEYRFIEHDLVLVDIHAGLVVDVLPGALPAADSP